MALQFCRQSGHKLSSLIQVTVTYHPRYKVVLGGVAGQKVKHEMEFLKVLYRDGCMSTCEGIDQRREFKWQG